MCLTFAYYLEGETKGKEIDIGSILTINPNLGLEGEGDDEDMDSSPPKERRALNNNRKLPAAATRSQPSLVTNSSTTKAQQPATSSMSFWHSQNQF